MRLRNNTMNGGRKGKSFFIMYDILYLLTKYNIVNGALKAVTFFRLDDFMAGFNTISLKLKEMYQV